MDMNGIKHLTTAPYHPASNGLAERVVQTLKTGLKKMIAGNIENKLARFLFQYRITPHTTTSRSPAELLMGRRPRSHLDLLRPNVTDSVSTKQERQKEGHDYGTVVTSYKVGEAVWVHNFAQGPTWLAGVVVQNQGQCSLHVKLTDGRVVHCHLDHIRQKVKSATPDPENPTSEADDPLMDPTSSNRRAVPLREQESVPPLNSEPTRSARQRKPPNHLTY